MAKVPNAIENKYCRKFEPPK